MKRVLVAGIGNELRGDDAVGLEVADRLRERVPPGVEVVGCEQEPLRLIDTWHGADSVVVVDAIDSGGEPGTVVRLDASVDQIAERTFRSSTHAFGVGETIELARALGKLPRRVIVYGVEGAEFAAGRGLSALVDAAVGSVVESILADLARES
jgi:hydrogenase maturation protease